MEIIEKIELINQIKEENNIEKKVNIIIEYLNEVKDKLLESRCNILSQDELLIILEELSKINICDDRRKLKEQFEEDFMFHIENILVDRFYCIGQTRDLDIVNYLILILKYAKKYSYKVDIKSSFTKFYYKFKISIEEIEKYYKAEEEYMASLGDIEDYDHFEYRKTDEYNLNENDEDYEFSISEALDNMYGK